MAIALPSTRRNRKRSFVHIGSPSDSITRLTFSGHETFQCRSLWLSKGYGFVHRKQLFSQPDAVVQLGVGKNMVASIRYWMNAFGLLHEQPDDELGKFLLGSNGKDPFLEDTGSLWLLHHRLVTRGVASIYSLIFNEFRKERSEFSKEQLLRFLRNKCQQAGEPSNDHILERDIGVFFKTYLPPRRKASNLDDEFSGILLDLDLIDEFEGEPEIRYRIAGDERKDLPADIVLFCVLGDKTYGNSVSFYELLNGRNSVGTVFALNSDGLMQKILALTKKYRQITYTEDAGIRELQFKTRPDRWDILKSYYAK